MCVIFSHRHKRNVLSFFLIVSFSFFTEPHTHTLFSVRILIFLGCIAIVPCVCWMCVCHFMYSFSIGRFEVSLHTSFNSHIQNDVSFFVLILYLFSFRFEFSLLLLYYWLWCEDSPYYAFILHVALFDDYLLRCDAVRSDSTDTLCTDDHFRTPQCNL